MSVISTSQGKHKIVSVFFFLIQPKRSFQREYSHLNVQRTTLKVKSHQKVVKYDTNSTPALHSKKEYRNRYAVAETYDTPKRTSITGWEDSWSRFLAKLDVIPETDVSVPSETCLSNEAIPSPTDLHKNEWKDDTKTLHVKKKTQRVWTSGEQLCALWDTNHNNYYSKYLWKTSTVQHTKY